jgi:uncharacterized protein
MTIEETIARQLAGIEADSGVRILYACESGSRAWGFLSADSDYDVRFIYVRPVDWYLSIRPGRNVIERPISDSLDISGWDLPKALELFLKSNPPLMEWLGSPIVYLDRPPLAARLRQLAGTYYSPAACAYHYLQMARNNCREYMKGDRVKVKKYFYILRPILAVKWIEQGLGVVPTPFHELVERLIAPGPLRTAIEKLIDDKRGGAELDEGPAIPEISRFVTEEMARFEEDGIGQKRPRHDIEPLNQLFRQILHLAWQLDPTE